MASVTSTMPELGMLAPDFRLPNTNPEVGNETVSLSDFAAAQALLIIFMCNHCPYVVHIRDALVAMIKEYQAKGLTVLGISANNVDTHPADAPDKMTEIARKLGFSFPYLYDESQDVAKAYQAACTPDFFLFDSERKLVYRGQFDKARPGSATAITGEDLRVALDTVLAGEPVSADQTPSMGCNIKWKVGNEPSYFDAA